MKAVGILVTACLVAGFASSAAAADSECALAENSRHIAIEVRRFQIPDPQPGLEDVARLMGPSPCDTRSEPRLVMENTELGLLAEDWRRGTRELEQARRTR